MGWFGMSSSKWYSKFMWLHANEFLWHWMHAKSQNVLNATQDVDIRVIDFNESSLPADICCKDPATPSVAQAPLTHW